MLPVLATSTGLGQPPKQPRFRSIRHRCPSRKCDYQGFHTYREVINCIDKYGLDVERLRVKCPVLLKSFDDRCLYEYLANKYGIICVQQANPHSQNRLTVEPRNHPANTSVEEADSHQSFGSGGDLDGGLDQFSPDSSSEDDSSGPATSSSQWSAEDTCSVDGALKTFLEDGDTIQVLRDGSRLTGNKLITHLLHLQDLFHLSENDTEVLIRFVKYILGVDSEEILPNTYRSCRRRFDRAGFVDRIEYLYLCPDCKLTVWVGSATKKIDYCGKCSTDTYKSLRCQGDIDRGVLVFILYDIREQLSTLFLRKSFAKRVRDHVRFRRKRKDAVIQTCFDTDLWRHVETIYNELIEEPRHIRVALATDGVCPFSLQFSKQSVWPILLEVLNLGPDVRRKKENVMLFGITVGSQAYKYPAFHAIQTYLVRILNELWDTGVYVEDCSRPQGDRSRKFFCKVMLWCTRHDSPGFAKVTH